MVVASDKKNAAKGASGKPGPPCTRIKSGLATLSPRIITH